MKDYIIVTIGTLAMIMILVFIAFPKWEKYDCLQLKEQANSYSNFTSPDWETYHCKELGVSLK